MIETHDEAGVTLRYGFVTALDETAHTIRAQIPDLEIETWWLPVLTMGSRGDRHYGLPDIGDIFPDTDPAYKDADSRILLKDGMDR